MSHMCQFWLSKISIEWYLGDLTRWYMLAVREPQIISVGASKFWRWEGFLSEFPQTCPKSCCATFAYKCSPTKIMKTFFWCGLQKEVFFQGFCPNFQEFCPDFQQIKTFGGVLASPTPSPPTPVPQMLRDQKRFGNHYSECFGNKKNNFCANWQKHQGFIKIYKYVLVWLSRLCIFVFSYLKKFAKVFFKNYIFFQPLLCLNRFSFVIKFMLFLS